MSKQIGDDEIRLIGQPGSHGWRPRWWLYVSLAAVVVGIAIWALASHARGGMATRADAAAEHTPDWLADADTTQPGIYHTSLTVDTTVLDIYYPVMATAELCLGAPDTADKGILMATLAADLRRDNGRIVGAFVLHGEPLSWGLSKRGYCAIIDGVVTVGVADNSPLFEQATETGGDFFRQYPAVDGGCAVRNNPENSAFRRALCSIDGRICIVASAGRMTMDAFACALVQAGVQDAVFLVGGSADGWYREYDGSVHRLGSTYVRNNRFVNYIVFRQQ